MAMSKKCFCTVMIFIVLALAGSVTAVIFFMNKNSNSTPNKEIISDSTTNIDQYVSVGEDDGFKTPSSSGKSKQTKTRQECLNWLQKPTKHFEFTARFGRSPIATRETLVARTGTKIVRNSYWLTGNPAKDSKAFDGILLQACMGKIPVIVIKMRPSEGLKISQLISWNFYKPPLWIRTWKEYDSAIGNIVSRLAGIPAIVVVEPDLLMFSFDLKNQQYRWINEKYEDEFLKRAQRIIKRLPKARIYMDVGNAAYLGQNLAYLDHMAITLLRLPGLRGFAINTMHFVNQTYNELIARKLWCRTGLHYIVDTSRNGGTFSKQSISAIEECLFDPPNVKKGLSPGWSWGSQSQVRTSRQKRWIQQLGSSSNKILSASLPPPTDIANKPTPETPFQPNNKNNNNMNSNDPNWAVNNYNNQINNQKNNMNNQQRLIPTPRTTIVSKPTASSNSRSDIRSVAEAKKHLRSFKSKIRGCVSKKSITSAHDANVWIKVPGESDGRLYPYETFRPCLMGHSIPCDDSCQLLVQTDSRSPQCQCENRPSRPTSSSSNKYNSFPIDNFSL